jgi:predicted DNA-binding protein
MSLDLHDYRGRITPEAHCALEAVARRTGRDRQEIVREILHGWAMDHIQDATLLDQLLRAEGLGGIGEVACGKPRDANG